MNMLIYVFPFVIGYAVFRGVMHLRAGRKMWAAQFFIMAGFVGAVFGFELWMLLKDSG